MEKEDIIRGHIIVRGATAAEQKPIFRDTYQHEVKRSVSEIVGGPPPRWWSVVASQKIGQCRTEKIPPHSIIRRSRNLTNQLIGSKN